MYMHMKISPIDYSKHGRNSLSPVIFGLLLNEIFFLITDVSQIRVGRLTFDSDTGDIVINGKIPHLLNGEAEFLELAKIEMKENEHWQWFRDCHEDPGVWGFLEECDDADEAKAAERLSRAH